MEADHSRVPIPIKVAHIWNGADMSNEPSYKGGIEFQIFKDGALQEKVFHAEFFTAPEDPLPYADGDFVDAEFYMSVVGGKYKVADGKSETVLTEPLQLNPTPDGYVKGFMRVSSVITSEIFICVSDEFPRGIAVYRLKPDCVITEGDIIAVGQGELTMSL